MEINLKGRVALVTGASGAIGRSIAIFLAQSGARVFAGCHVEDSPNSRELLRQCTEQGVKIELLPFDVGDMGSTREAVGRAEQLAGKVDILINCAGMTRDAPFRRMSEDQWKQVMHVNLDSVFNTTRAVIEGMMTRGWGRIVNISSINGQKGQYGQVNYSASKAGMHGFTMALAQEAARKGVTVNTICPGYIDSPMIRAVPENIRSKILETIPAGRFGEPRDVAAAVTFLCSEQAAFINGANLAVNGAQYTSA